MFVRNSIWARIRGDFTQPEKDLLTAAIDGEMLCPPGYHVDETRLAPDLFRKLRDAMDRVAPGA
jgi:hypothetical protein